MIICATGHRKLIENTTDPKKFGREYMKLRLYRWMTQQEGVEACISGMAVGFDTIFAQAVLKAQLPLWAYIPCMDQYKKWAQSDQEVYFRLLDQAAKVIYISREYHDECMKFRNRRMVNDSDMVVAYYDGVDKKTSGTGQTCRMATQQKKPIVNFFYDPEIANLGG